MAEKFRATRSIEPGEMGTAEPAPRQPKTELRPRWIRPGETQKVVVVRRRKNRRSSR